MTDPTPDLFAQQAEQKSPAPETAPLSQAADAEASSTTEGQSPLPSEKPKKLILPYILLVVFLLSLVPGPAFFVALLMPGPMQETKTVIIPRGTSIQEMGLLLDKNEVVLHPLLFRAAAKLLSNGSLKAGEYAFEPGLTVIDVISMLREGKTVMRQFTAAEGLTSLEIVTLLRNIPALTGDITKTPEEGSLLPETYRYSYGDTRTSVIERMQKDQREILGELWEKRDGGLPFKSPQEALTLASIVEKETGKMAEERPRVAGVFLNRLRLGMALQSDPTVIYAIAGSKGALGRSLSHADLAMPSPYNTYANPGLPPGPICNPGQAALMAVLHPEKNDFLYFVANGTGGHSFAKTLDEHNKNVSRWISLNRP